LVQKYKALYRRALALMLCAAVVCGNTMIPVAAEDNVPASEPPALRAAEVFVPASALPEVTIDLAELPRCFNKLNKYSAKRPAESVDYHAVPTA